MNSWTTETFISIIKAYWHTASTGASISLAHSHLKEQITRVPTYRTEDTLRNWDSARLAQRRLEMETPNTFTHTPLTNISTVLDGQPRGLTRWIRLRRGQRGPPCCAVSAAGMRVLRRGQMRRAPIMQKEMGNIGQQRVETRVDGKCYSLRRDAQL